MSGLSELQPRPETQVTDPVLGTEQNPPTTTEEPPSMPMDAGPLPSSDVGNKDESAEEKNEPQPEEKQTGPMDAGMVGRDDPSDPASPESRGGPGGPPKNGPVAGAAGAAVAGAGGSPVVPAMEPMDPMGIAGTGGTGGAEPVEPVCMYPTAALRCSVTEQCGCDADENCAVDDARVQCLAAGLAGENQYCRVSSDCAVGYQCANNACLKLCDSANPDCGPAASCVQLYWGDDPVPGVFMCSSACNPIDPQRTNGELKACGSGLLCSWFDAGTFCSSSNRATRKHGEFCRDQYDCAAGYACAPSATCAKWCATNTDCPSGFSCALDSPITMGQKSFGMCKPDCLDRNERICGLTTQCGCDANHSCDTWINDARDVVHECRPLGTAGAYQTCDSSYDCRRDLQCVGSECRPICLTDFDCPRYGTCQLSYFDAAPFTPAGSSCRKPCDPADPYNSHGEYGRCSSGSACDVTSDGVSYCRSAELRGTVGASCSGNSDCAVGHTCTSNDYCVALCRSNSDCASDSICQAFATAQFAASVEWGYCALRQ